MKVYSKLGNIELKSRSNNVKKIRMYSEEDFKANILQKDRIIFELKSTLEVIES